MLTGAACENIYILKKNVFLAADLSCKCLYCVIFKQTQFNHKKALTGQGLQKKQFVYGQLVEIHHHLGVPDSFLYEQEETDKRG